LIFLIFLTTIYRW